MCMTEYLGRCIQAIVHVLSLLNFLGMYVLLPSCVVLLLWKCCRYYG